MKLKIFIVLTAVAGLIACSTPYRATDTVVYDVPAGTLTTFNTQYPGATNVVWTTYDGQTIVPIDWEMTGWTTLDANARLVRFDLDNENYYGWYDRDGNWVGSTYVMRDHTNLPAPIGTLLISRYAGYSITSVNREFQKDRMAYEIELKRDDSKVKLLVDANGNIIRLKEKMK